MSDESAITFGRAEISVDGYENGTGVLLRIAVDESIVLNPPTRTETGFVFRQYMRREQAIELLMDIQALPAIRRRLDLPDTS